MYPMPAGPSGVTNHSVSKVKQFVYEYKLFIIPIWHVSSATGKKLLLISKAQIA
jgi:hypothetical protein